MKDIIENAFIEILSGIAQYHKDGGVITKNEWGDEITISFPTKSPRYAVVREYWENGNKWWETEWQNGELHGKSLRWYEDGSKCWEAEYREGKPINEKYY